MKGSDIVNTSVKNSSIDKRQSPRYNWSATPSFRMRQAVIESILKKWQLGSFLEVGIGTGSMTKVILDYGYKGFGFDIDPLNIEIAKKNLCTLNSSITLINDLSGIAQGSLDFLFAFEVLEHIADDRQALEIWTEKLKPGASVLVSVPARMKYFREDDQIVGHVRRYEKPELINLLANAGYTDINIMSYGVPLMNLSRRIGARLQNSDMKTSGSRIADSDTDVERSIRSGISRPIAVNTGSQLIPDWLFTPFAKAQCLFFNFDIGEGYIATAKLHR